LKLKLDDLEASVESVFSGVVASVVLRAGAFLVWCCCAVFEN